MDKKTVLLKAYREDEDREDIKKAGRILREGGIVAIPTETVYGLAGNALDPSATAKIYAAKGRPSDNPLIVHIAHPGELEPLVLGVPQGARRLMEAFWPGPLTIILPKSPAVPGETSGGLDTVAVRMPQNPIARAIIREAGAPLAAPSANRSGGPSPTTWRHCVDDLWGRVDAIVESFDCDVGVESTVITFCAGDAPRLLRPGAVTLEQLRGVLGRVEVDRGVLEKLPEGTRVQSPGMKYKHYSPASDVILVKGSAEEYGAYLREHRAPGEYAMCFTEDLPYLEEPALSYGSSGDHAQQANRLFDLLRELDRLGVKRVYVHAPQVDGVGLAVYNRLVRAAAFQIVTAK